MLGTLMGQVNEKWDLDGEITCCGQFRGPFRGW